MTRYCLKYKTIMPIADCIASITQTPWEYGDELMPLWYNCQVISSTQLLVTFTGGKFHRIIRTQFQISFVQSGVETIAEMRFLHELLGLPPMTTTQEIDLFMHQKIQGIRIS